MRASVTCHRGIRSSHRIPSSRGTRNPRTQRRSDRFRGSVRRVTGALALRSRAASGVTKKLLAQARWRVVRGPTRLVQQDGNGRPRTAKTADVGPIAQPTSPTIPIGHCEIRPTVPIEVADHDGPRSSAYLEISSRLKRALSLAKEDGRPRGAPAGHRQIRNLVSVEVRHGDRAWIASRLEMLGWPKSSIAVSQQDSNRIGALESITGAIGHDQVQNIVAVEVTHRDGTGAVPDPELARGFKPPSAACYQDRNLARSQTRYGQIGTAIPVEVSHRNRKWTVSHLYGWSRGKRSVTKPEQDGNGRAWCTGGLPGIGDRQIRNPIAIQVTGGDEPRRHADREGLGRPKRTVAPAHQNECRVRLLISHREILVAISIKVGGGNRGQQVSDVQCSSGCESAVPLTEENVHVMKSGSSHRQILNRIAVEIADCH